MCKFRGTGGVSTGTFGVSQHHPTELTAFSLVNYRKGPDQSLCFPITISKYTSTLSSSCIAMSHDLLGLETQGRGRRADPDIDQQERHRGLY